MNISNSAYNPFLSPLPLENNLAEQTNEELSNPTTVSTTDLKENIENFQSDFDLRDKSPNRFLHSFNQEKIDKMVQEYKVKLQKQQDSNPDSFIDIEYLTRQFKKGLQEKLVEINAETSSYVKIFSQLQNSLNSKY